MACRMNLKSVVAVVVLIAIASSTNFARAAKTPPNFILCMADDQGWGDVAYNGHPTIKTPVLDEMAKTGLRFDNFYAAAPVCSPTRGSVLTGRHPNRFGCFRWGNTLRPQEITVAERLQKAGYTTGHFGKWHLGSVRAGSPVNPGNSGFDEWASSPNFYENSPLLSKNGKVIATKGESSMVTVDLALEFIAKAKKANKPFLAVIWFGNPHTPHQAQEHLKKLYPKQSPKLQNYLGEITGIDQSMGHLRKELRKMKIADNTLLWYTSDNGGRRPGSTGGLRAQKGSIYEGGLRVPAIIEWPAVVKSPRRTSLPCNTVDIYPTLLSIAGVKYDGKDQPTLDGESLQPLIEGKNQKRKRGFGFWQYPGRGRGQRSRAMLAAYAKELKAGNPSKDPKLLDADAGKITKKYPTDVFPGHAAWVEGDYKLHRIARGKTGAKFELYNLKTDAKESKNILDDHADLVARMKKSLAAWQQSVMRSCNGADY